MKYIKRLYTQKQFEKDIKTLSNKIKEYEKLNNVKFKAIYGIPRGGLIPAVYLSHLLDINIVFDIKKIKKKYLKDIIIIDEINDTGNTMKKFSKYFTVCLHYKPWNSCFKPDMYIKEINDTDWIIYNWEISSLINGK